MVPFSILSSVSIELYNEQTENLHDFTIFGAVTGVVVVVAFLCFDFVRFA